MKGVENLINTYDPKDETIELEAGYVKKRTRGRKLKWDELVDIPENWEEEAESRF